MSRQANNVSGHARVEQLLRTADAAPWADAPAGLRERVVRSLDGVQHPVRGESWSGRQAAALGGGVAECAAAWHRVHVSAGRPGCLRARRCADRPSRASVRRPPARGLIKPDERDVGAHAQRSGGACFRDAPRGADGAVAPAVCVDGVKGLRPREAPRADGQERHLSPPEARRTRRRPCCSHAPNHRLEYLSKCSQSRPVHSGRLTELSLRSLRLMG